MPPAWPECRENANGTRACSGQLPFYFGGSIVMEHIFGLPGLGSFVLEAISRRDYPVIQAVNLFVALLVVLSNVLVDLSYGVLDPRIRQP